MTRPCRHLADDLRLSGPLRADGVPVYCRGCSRSLLLTRDGAVVDFAGVHGGARAVDDMTDPPSGGAA
jgi:hypothetical protein